MDEKLAKYIDNVVKHIKAHPDYGHWPVADAIRAQKTKTQVLFLDMDDLSALSYGLKMCEQEREQASELKINSEGKLASDSGNKIYSFNEFCEILNIQPWYKQTT